MARYLVTGGAGFTPPLQIKDSEVCYPVYVLRSQRNGLLYIGCTSDLQARVTQHEDGDCIATKGKGPWELIYYKGYRYCQDAFRREKLLKQFGGAYRQLKRRLHYELDESLQPDTGAIL